MTADFYIKKLKKGYLVTAVSDDYGRNREEWAFSTLETMLQFLKITYTNQKIREMAKKNGP